MAARATVFVLWASTMLHQSFVSAQSSSERALFRVRAGLMVQMKEVMLASVRANWEQGTAAMAVLEADDSEYSIFADNPFRNHGRLPVATLRLSQSAVTRQGGDGRLSQTVGDGNDGSALDGAASGVVVLLGMYAQPSRRDFWRVAADRQLGYLLYSAPRTSTGAISHRADSRQYWNDGVFMMPPYIAAYGAVSNNQTLLQIAYDQCRLYRNALRQNGPTGPLWGHIFSDDGSWWVDQGLWSTGNAWAALGMLHVHTTILKSEHADDMRRQATDLMVWTREILDSSFGAMNDEDLIPNYVQGGSDFSDTAASAALAAVAYRLAKMHPETFGSWYTFYAAKLRDAVLSRLDEMGMMAPVVDPLRWDEVGQVSAEAQAFGVMMMAAWRDYLGL